MIVDESVNRNFIQALRRAGHAVISIAEEFQGLGDEEIARMSLSPPQIIFSEDKDFGELVYHFKVSVIGLFFFDMILRNLN
jgi:predicted nuclease of predicted toxin-antitoxin system